MVKTFGSRAAVLASLLCLSQTAGAALIDLTADGSSATINGALFEVSDPNTGAGSGAIDSFIRTQNSPSEKGYNTDGTFEFDQVAGCCTHSITLGELTVVDVGGTDYFELQLDINEPGNATAALITLQELELWVNTTTGADDDYSDGLGTKVWDLAGNMVEMNGNVNTSGSGDFDYDVLFPTSILAGFGPGDYLYLYNVFGDTNMMSSPSEAGFEEWAAKTGGDTFVPVPAAVWLFGSGLLGLVGVARRKHRS